MMTKLERFGLGLLLAPIPPLLGLLIFWWGSYALLPESWIGFGAIFGLFFGILVDALSLKRWINRAAHYGFKFWVALYLFYSMGTFGFFMGVPVFNVFWAIPAGFVVALKLAADQQRLQRSARLTAWFTTGVMVVICVSSAALALSDPYTSANLEGMFGLKFQITQEMLVALIVTGGAFLLAFNWWLTTSAIWVSSLILRRKVA